MKILVLNCGSSSIKYKLYDMKDESVLAQGIVERIGLDEAFIKVKLNNGEKVQIIRNCIKICVVWHCTVEGIVEHNHLWCVWHQCIYSTQTT